MPATKISLTSGNRQRAAVGVALTNALTVTVADGTDAPVSGVAVVFHIASAPQGSTGHAITGSVQTLSVNSDINGIASVILTLGSVPGAYTVTATSAGLTGSPLTFTVTAVPAYAIIELDRVKRYLGKKLTEYDADDFLQDCINTVSRQIEKYINGPVNIQTYTHELYNGEGRDYVLLSHVPAVSLANNAVSDVQHKSSPDASWENVTDTLAYILIGPPNSYELEIYGGAFYEGDGNVRISYKAGYSDDDKADFVRVCIEAVAEMYQESALGKGRLGQDSQSVAQADVTTSYYSLSDKHQKILRRYRRVKV